jgi:ribonuclease P protein component
VLDRQHRLTSSAGFATAVRQGRRAAARTVVVHLRENAVEHPADAWSDPRVGFVVGKTVGNAVTRNRVKRQLRHLARERLTSLPGSAVLVVRALPAAASASYADLGADLDRALLRAARPPAGPAGTVAARGALR